MNKQGVVSVTVDTDRYNELLETEMKFEELKKLLEADNPCFVTVSMIAQAQGYERNDLFNQPWLMPNYGKGYEYRKKRFWRFDEYLDWIVIPLEERRQTYLRMKEEAS